MGTCNDALLQHLSDTLRSGMQLGQRIWPLHLPGQVGWVLGLYSNPDTRAYNECYHLHVVSVIEGVMVSIFTRNWSVSTQAYGVLAKQVDFCLPGAGWKENGE